MKRIEERNNNGMDLKKKKLGKNRNKEDEQRNKRLNWMNEENKNANEEIRGSFIDQKKMVVYDVR